MVHDDLVRVASSSSRSSAPTASAALALLSMAGSSSTPGRGGLPRVVATHAASGATLEVYLHGAHVTSFACRGSELLFVSSRAAFDGVGPIRGGIPLAFPQFAAQGPLPMHGFARTSAWTLEAAADGLVELSLADSAATRAAWPHAFAARLRLTFAGAALRVELRVENAAGAAAPLPFEALQHAYIALGAGAVAAGGAVQVEGLEAALYRDKTRGGADFTDAPGALPLRGDETDRVFVAPPAREVVLRGVRGAPHTAVRVAFGARVLDAGGADDAAGAAAAPVDVVVWNPGPTRNAAIADLDADAWTRFACIEPGRVSRETALPAGGLPPGKAFVLDVTYTME